MTLKEIREKADLSISNASQKLCITYDYLCMLENNRRKPSLKLMKKMSKLYNTKPEEIFLAVYRTIRSEHTD